MQTVNAVPSRLLLTLMAGSSPQKLHQTEWPWPRRALRSPSGSVSSPLPSSDLLAWLLEVVVDDTSLLSSPSSSSLSRRGGNSSDCHWLAGTVCGLYKVGCFLTRFPSVPPSTLVDLGLSESAILCNSDCNFRDVDEAEPLPPPPTARPTVDDAREGGGVAGTSRTDPAASHPTPRESLGRLEALAFDRRPPPGSSFDTELVVERL